MIRSALHVCLLLLVVGCEIIHERDVIADQSQKLIQLGTFDLDAGFDGEFDTGQDVSARHLAGRRNKNAIHNLRHSGINSTICQVVPKRVELLGWWDMSTEVDETVNDFPPSIPCFGVVLMEPFHGGRDECLKVCFWRSACSTLQAIQEAISHIIQLTQLAIVKINYHP